MLKRNLGKYPLVAVQVFAVTKLLSIYAEPGVAYYFDNKSSLRTIYQEKPFNFNLNLGLRFNLGK